jgi:hypothetical protein
MTSIANSAFWSDAQNQLFAGKLHCGFWASKRKELYVPQ